MTLKRIARALGIAFACLGSLVFVSAAISLVFGRTEEVEIENVGAADLLVKHHGEGFVWNSTMRLRAGERRRVTVCRSEELVNPARTFTIGVGSGADYRERAFSYLDIHQARAMKLGVVVIAVKPGYVGIEWREPVPAVSNRDDDFVDRFQPEGR